MFRGVLSTSEGIVFRPYTGDVVGIDGRRYGYLRGLAAYRVALMRPQYARTHRPGLGRSRSPAHIEHRYDSEPAGVALLRQGQSVGAPIMRTYTLIVQLRRPRRGVLWSRAGCEAR